MSEITGAQQRKLKEAIVDGFPTWNALSQMVLFQLDESLAAITSQALGLDANAFELVTWAKARGMAMSLALAARNQNPGNAALNAVADALGLGAMSGQPNLEKIVSANAARLNPEQFREGLVKAEWCVCRIDVNGEGRGTGFLVGPDLVLTNFHVIETIAANEHAGCRARFDYKVAKDGAELVPGRAVAFADDWIVDQARYSRFDLLADPKGGEPNPEELDFALLRLAEPIGNESVGANEAARERGWAKLATEPPTANPQMLCILQHPQAAPMKLSIGMTETLKANVAGNRVRYQIPTEAGSSGSPVFNKDWVVVALHHSGDPKGIKPEYNEAIPMFLIVKRPLVAAALAA